MLFDMSELDKITNPLNENFVEGGIETPYILESYSLFITKVLAIAVIVIPILLIINIGCAKKPLIRMFM